MRVLIVGCGYMGVRLGGLLARAGHEVQGLRREPDAAEALREEGIEPLVGDLTQRRDLEALPGPWDAVVNAVSSGRGGVDAYQKVFVDGTRLLLDVLAEKGIPARYIQVSSTSVYGQADGSLVTEASPAEPDSPTSAKLVEGEEIVRAAFRENGFPGIIVRSAGIYGPDRAYLLRSFLEGRARVHGSGGRWLNMIHRDDLARVIVALLERGVPGETYIASDDEPVTELAFYTWLAGVLGMDEPPRADEAALEGRKRGRTSKRLSNLRIRGELGVDLRYPTYREGYGEAVRALGD